MFRASSLPGKPGRFRASNYLCSSEHTCIDCIAQIPRFRAVPSYSLLGTLLLCSARNIASLPASMLGTLLLCLLLCSEHCFFAGLYARNIASFYALLGTLLLCLLLCSQHCFYARNTVFLPDPSALCLLLCFARNPASLQVPSFRLSLIWNTYLLAAYPKSPSFLKPGMLRAYDYQQCGKKKYNISKQEVYNYQKSAVEASVQYFLSGVLTA